MRHALLLFASLAAVACGGSTGTSEPVEETIAQEETYTTSGDEVAPASGEQQGEQ